MNALDRQEAGVRYLIVNGDDFGLTPGINRGIVECCRRGILTSTSLMVNRPAAPDAAALASQVPELSVGLHLEIDRPTARNLPGALETQLQSFERLMGAPPTHLDSHRDRHREPDVLASVLELAGRLGVPVRGHSPVRSVGDFYGYWDGEDHPEQVGVAALLEILETAVRRGVTELVCHPGFVDDELDSSYAAVRDTEVETLCDPRVRDALDRGGIRLVGFQDLPALVHPGASPKPHA